MADKKISQLTAASTPLAGTEVLPIVQSGSTVKVASDDLTVKNVRSNVTTGILQVAGPGAGTTRTMTVPNANFTAARTDAGQTFSGTQTFSAATNLATSSGDVGIFTSTPDVFGRFYTKTVGMTSNGTTALQINGTTYGAIDLGAGGTRTAGINASATEMQIGSITAIPVYINAGGGTKMYVYSSGGISTDSTDPGAGNVRVGNGNFVVGTAAKGIDFSANTHAAGMTSELLNWYEEGTWTPVLSATTTPPSATYANRTARYTRVGRLVTVSVWMNISSQSGGA